MRPAVGITRICGTLYHYRCAPMCQYLHEYYYADHPAVVQIVHFRQKVLYPTSITDFLPESPLCPAERQIPPTAIVLLFSVSTMPTVAVYRYGNPYVVLIGFNINTIAFRGFRRVDQWEDEVASLVAGNRRDNNWKQLFLPVRRLVNCYPYPVLPLVLMMNMLLLAVRGIHSQRTGCAGIAEASTCAPFRSRDFTDCPLPPEGIRHHHTCQVAHSGCHHRP